MSLIIDHVPEPKVDEENNFAMLATLLDYDSYLGRCLTGKVISGNAKINDPVKAIDLNSNLIENGRLTKLFKFEGTKKVPVDTEGFWAKSSIKTLHEKMILAENKALKEVGR